MVLPRALVVTIALALLPACSKSGAPLADTSTPPFDLAGGDALQDSLRDGLPPGVTTPGVEITLVDNAEGDLAARGYLATDSLFRKTLQVAAEAWARELNSPHTLHIVMRPDRNVARGGGTYSTGALFKTVDSYSVYQPGPLTRLETGENPGAAQSGGADILLTFNLAFTDEHYWLDPELGAGGGPVPSGKTDWISIVTHELGHGLGMAGRRSFEQATYGQLLGSLMSLFDSMTHFAGSGAPLVGGQPNDLLFDGPAATKLYGGPVPLASFDFGAYLFTQNIYHVSDYSDDPQSADYWQKRCDQVTLDTAALMTACPVPVDGARLRITDLDRAIVQDLGYQLARPLATN